MMVCICHNVSELKLKTLWESHRDLEVIVDSCKAGTECGACTDEVRKICNFRNIQKTESTVSLECNRLSD